MKVIETKYKGYHFRSRLEARWAVFLDEIGLPYRYEEEGFDLNGIWYLPDFWISDWQAFVEIKGQTPTDEELEKARRLRDSSKKLVLIIAGSPWPGDYKAFPFMPPDENFDLLDDGAEFLQCRRCENIFIARKDNDNVVSMWLGHPQKTDGCKGCSDREPYLSFELEKAFKAAREARFES